MVTRPPIDWRPLGPQTEPPMTGHDIICLHTMVGYLTSTDRMFKANGYKGTESHFGVGGRWGPDAAAGLDGAIWQWQAISHQADANLDGNPRVISIETADNAPARPVDIEVWTPQQAASIAQLVAWLCTPAAHAGCPTSWTCHRSGIPAALIPDTKPGRRGIGWHQQGCDPTRVAGGVLWSSAYGKECPGPRRVRQLRDEVLPAVGRLLNSTTGDDMPLTDADLAKVREVVRAELAADHAAARPWLSPSVAAIAEGIWPGITAKGIPTRYLLELVWGNVTGDDDQQAQVAAEVHRLLELAGPVPPADPPVPAP